MKQICLLLISVISLGCTSDDAYLPDLSGVYPIENMASLTDLGVLNAVKKARQMTDLQFTPINNIEANGNRIYKADEKYTGVIYSSVKETGTYVGSNISFHTYMTAIHNPRSKIYTEHLNESPYHGTNCKAYYGTVCSGLVSYALGIDYASYDFPVSELMENIDYSNINNIHIADILWKSGHVAIITDIVKDDSGHVLKIEISESTQSGCRRYTIDGSIYLSWMTSSFQKIFRYIEIYKNVDYTPVPEFVAVFDETPVEFVYNNDLCTVKGDKACFREDEDVVINIMRDFEFLDVYKDGQYYKRIDNISGQDVNLQKLPYGDYKANICFGDNTKSDYTYWKVVNMKIEADHSSNRLYFRSDNAMPYKLGFSNIRGSRKYPYTELYCHTLTDDERSRGYVEIPMEMTKADCPYIQFYFSTEYGTIMDKPIDWFKY